jgi:alpha-beta hydrolase superfamily lysophospholipase
MKNNYPDKPYFLFGHSMGSFFARAYVTRHGKNLDGVIFEGTSGGIDGTAGLLAFIDMLEKAHGDKHRSKLVYKMAFGAYNARIADRKTKYDWLSSDSEAVEKYCSDKRCTFIFTLNGFENLVKVLWYVSNDKWYESYPKELPTLLLGGSADPVGNYGRGVLKVYNGLREQCCNAQMKIYEGARHELVHEQCNSQVFEDMADFMEKATLKEESNSTENSTESEDN